MGENHISRKNLYTIKSRVSARSELIEAAYLETLLYIQNCLDFIEQVAKIEHSWKKFSQFWMELTLSEIKPPLIKVI